MINPENFFLDIQQAAVDILDADAYFDGVPILTEQLGDLDNAIEIVIGKCGLCVIIESPFASVTSKDTAATFFGDIPIVVTIWEDTVLNRFNEDINIKHHTGAALIALWLLTHSRPMKDGEQIANVFVCEEPTMVNLASAVDRERFPNIQGMQLRLSCSAGFVYVPQLTLLSENNTALLSEMGVRLTTDRPFTK
jgi:hypothetical protein